MQFEDIKLKYIERYPQDDYSQAYCTRARARLGQLVDPHHPEFNLEEFLYSHQKELGRLRLPQAVSPKTPSERKPLKNQAYPTLSVY